jgi:GON domain
VVRAGPAGLLALAACGFQPNAQAIDAARTPDAPRRPIDAAIDGPPDAPLAASCVGLADGSATLYIGGDVAKPWAATCANELEYLPVSGSNFGQYTSSTHTGGTTVHTDYTQLRLDPAMLAIDVDDQTFATSTGQLLHGGNGPSVTSMPLGVAMDCTASISETGLGSVDLGGTPFTIASTYEAQGNNIGSAETTLSTDGRSIALTGGGNCGWTAVHKSPTNPFNKNGGDFILHVAYAPP